MPRLTRNVHRRPVVRWGRAVAVAVGLILLTGSAVYAQNRPPLPNEPVATEGTVKQFYRGLNYVVVKTMDGVEHVYNFTKDLIVHGGKKPDGDALEGLREGTHVAIHYSTTGAKASAEEIDILGDEGLRITEGVVSNIDRGKKEITIRFTNGHTETLQMTTRAAAESQAIVAGTPSRIVVYYANEEGRKVAHYFKLVS
jgi:hypothetical protein